MSAQPVDVLAVLHKLPCLCLSVAQLGERDPGCDRCQAYAAVVELVEALRNSPCYCQDGDGDGDAVTCDRCSALARVQGGAA